MKRILIVLLILAGCALSAAAQDASPVKKHARLVIGDTVSRQKLLVRDARFAQRDTCDLSMDLYLPYDNLDNHPCVVFVYGGGFVMDNQKEESNVKFCSHLAEDGFVTAAINYRLGLKGVKSKGALDMVSDMDVAVRMAEEDLFSAVEYLRANAAELTIDPDRIILIGSSAGAITVLHADYDLCNRREVAAAMPDDFHFSGVVALAGAILSHEGKCNWKVHAPAPTMFLHGTSDQLVNYKQIQVFRLGWFGTNSLVKRFEKFDYPYMCLRFENRYHEVAAFHNKCYNQILWFLNNYVLEKKNWQIDATVADPDLDLGAPWNFDIKAVYGGSTPDHDSHRAASQSPCRRSG